MLFFILSLINLIIFRNFGQLLHTQSEYDYSKINFKSFYLFRLRLLLHKALVKCCNKTDKSLSKMSTSDAEQDATPDLEELDSENDEEHSTLSHILQKISECN